MSGFLKNETKKKFLIFNYKNNACLLKKKSKFKGCRDA